MRARTLSYTAGARRDMAGIYLYYRDKAGAAKAAEIVDRVRRAINNAREAPLAGAPRFEFGEGCRVAIAHPYLIYYRLADAELIVLRVLHWAQDRDEIMRGDR